MVYPRSSLTMEGMTGPVQVGQRLKAERERRGLAYVNVARATGVYIHHLAAIEFGRYDELPDPDAVDAHVYAYATYLGLDGAAIVVDLRRERGLPARTLDIPKVRVRRHRRLPSRWVAAPVFLAILALALWWALRPAAPPEGPPPERPAPTASVPTLPAEPPPEPSETPVPEPPAEPPTPATSAAPPETTASMEEAPTLSISEHGVGRGIENHRLIQPDDRFEVGTQVWFWTRVTGGSPGDRIHHVWLREGREVQSLTLPIGASSWRTHSSKSLLPGSAGSWVVEARDDEGNVLARDAFACVP
jgi:transcriptional regulator with XRE-family HTH domain